MEIIKTFNKTTAEELQIGGVFTSVSWESLMPAISGLIRLRDDEVIDGFVISDTDIRVKLSRKKGRKVK